jgi:phosphatidylserine/phosphatidylglycerophosphate/cardiolipin synthase-like enzyme
MQDKLISNEKIPIAINDLIDEASEYLLLVSPYVKIWGHLRNHLEKCKAKTKVAIIRDENLDEKAEIIRELNALGITVKALQNLHAKIYLSDKACIISSMNLYDFSAANSEEVAVQITDRDSLTEIKRYVKDNLSYRSTDIDLKKIKPASPRVEDHRPHTPKEAKGETGGHCIRCGKGIKLNPEKPYCKSCFESWALYENPEYREKHCHFCGKPEGTSFLKPVCKPCFYKLTSY